LPGEQLVTPFADRLVAAVRRLGPLCVGVDPHPDMIPAIFGPPGAASARAWSLAVIDRAAGRVAVVKPQAGLFERWGSAGVAALEDVCRAAREAGLIVLMDAKRGDIGSTALGYAEAYLGADAPFECDCVTVNPWMGLDTLEPYLSLAERNGKGLAVLARTSNPGAADFQARLSEGRPMYLHVADALAPLAARLKGPASGWSGLMLVAGATSPREAALLREAAPGQLFLVPGYGAQGAAAADAIAGFVPGPDELEGGIVNASRSVTFPASLSDPISRAGSPAECLSMDSWKTAVGSAIEAAQADLRSAARIGR
jgi:orotidine-5'-phosphate decarboxylase